MYKAFFIMRTDLELTPGKLAVQVGHGVDWVHTNQNIDLAAYWDWMNPHLGDRRKVVLRINSEEKLINLEASLQADGIACSRIVDSGYTEVEENTITGICVFPSKENKKLKRLQLLK